MEAAVALGVVSSVISIAQLTAKLTTVTGKLSKSASDALPENEWLEEVAKRNRDLATQLDNATHVPGPLTRSNTAISKLASRCLEESAALTASLQELKVPLHSDGTKSKRGALKVVIKAVWREGDLKERHGKLVSLERQLSAVLIQAIRTSQQEGFEGLRNLMQRNGRDCVTVVRDSHTVLAEKINALQLGLQTVGQGVGRVEQGVSKVAEGVDRVEQRQLNDIEQKRVDDLLQSLVYDGMDSRRDMIVDPIGSTYDWAFEDDKQPTKQWLDSSVKHCWISGEPGTGKSVFTKSCRLDRRKIAALRTQTRNDNLLILDYYFWIAGDSHQRSLRAMVQHLCFQALQQYSVLTEVAFPDEWVSGLSLRGLSWTTKTLVTALKRIVAASGFQTCIIIDGLDECDDKDRPELIRVLLDLTKATCARLCVSSRPWSDFEKAFNNWARLKLPENNAWDIFQLVCRRLELADDPQFRDCFKDARLFDLIRQPFIYEFKRNSLDPSQRLIYDLCFKGKWNVLWVTAVLDPVCKRLEDGQSLNEVMRYIDDLPGDVEDYYYDLVYTRIHSTYRTGKVSECAMALKIVSCMADCPMIEHSRFELIWALQTSISTGVGIAHDPGFFAQPSSSQTSEPLNQKTYQTVNAFVKSRCKDLMVSSEQTRYQGHPSGRLSYQHRVIHDFILSERMQTSLNTALPEHFRRPQFTFHLGLLSARQSYARAHCAEHDLGRLVKVSTTILYVNLQEYLSELQGPLDQRAAQTCDEITTDVAKLGADVDVFRVSWKFYLARTDMKNNVLRVPLTLYLARIQRFTSVSEIIRLESQKSSNHIELIHVKGANVRHGWSYANPSPIRQTVSTTEQHTKVIDLTPVRGGPYYLPCRETWWTAFLFQATIIKLGHDVGPVWSESRAATYVARAFLEAGASIEVELCIGDHQCHGHACVCPDQSTHSRLYECPESSTDQNGKAHKHKWLSAANILSDQLKIPRTELLEIVARNRSTRSIPQVDFLDLARETEAVWQRHVEAYVRNKMQVLSRGFFYATK
jgi:hypothetical protein